MKFGLSLRNTGVGSSRDAIDAGAETAARLGWEAVWTTDHVLVPHSAAAEYGRTFEAIATLAWVGARHPNLRLGTSVIVVPQRNAVLLAKELATLDVLSEGRVIAGVGIDAAMGIAADMIAVMMCIEDQRKIQIALLQRLHNDVAVTRIDDHGKA